MAVLWLAVWFDPSATLVLNIVEGLRPGRLTNRNVERFVMRSAYEPHHGKEAGESLAPGVGGRHAASPASLFITTSGGGVLCFDLTGSLVHVGRAADNDLVITDLVLGWETTSRHHARLYYDARLRRWIVRDEGSRNGVYVSGVRTGHNILLDGARLSFGSVEALFREAR